MHYGVDVGEQEARQGAVQHLARPYVDEPGGGAPDVAAEEGRAVGVGVFEPAGDRPGIADHPFAVADDRHQLLAAEGDLLLLREAAQLGLVGKPLVRERHAGPPGVRAEAQRVGGSREIVEDDGHGISPLQTPAASFSRKASRWQAGLRQWTAFGYHETRSDRALTMAGAGHSLRRALVRRPPFGEV